MGSPLAVRGLDYWDLAARSAEPVAPLRSFLEKLDLGDELLAFVRSATDDDFRLELLARVAWDTGARPLPALIAAIKDDLISFGASRGVTSHESARALDSLLARVAQLLSTKGPKRLSHADFCTSFDAATMELVPRAEIAMLRSQQGATAPPGDSNPVLEEPLPLVHGAIPRTTLVDGLAKKLQRSKALFLSGSTGLGKTSLALLISARFKTEFLWIPLRGSEPDVVSRKLSAGAKELRSRRGPVNIVLDDVDLANPSRFERQLLALVFLVTQRGGLAVATGYSKAGQQLLSKLWLDSGADVEVPYFSPDEIAELLRQLNAPSEEYIREQVPHVVLATHGHPQLVHARVARLALDGWPPVAADLSNDPDVRDVRSRARRRLVQELPSDEAARAFAYRLSVVIGPFRRERALAVAAVSPEVRLPGEKLDLLVGPWLERVGEQLFRVSPLLANVGTEALPSDELIKVHQAMAEFPFRQGAVAPNEVGYALFHGLAAQRVRPLARLARALTETRIEKVRGLADALFPFTLAALQPGGQLCKDDPVVDVLLRVAQFKAAVANDGRDSVGKIIDRTLERLNKVPESAREVITALALGSFLSTIAVPIPPSKSVPMIGMFMRVAAGTQLATTLPNLTRGLSKLAGRETTPYAELFRFECARIEGIDALDDLLTELEKLEPVARSPLLEAFEDDSFADLLVSNAWWRDTDRNRLDVAKAVAVCERAARLGIEWKRPKLSRSAYASLAVLHDEYGENAAAALDAVRRAETVLGADDGRLLIGKGKVLLHVRRFEEAADALEVGLRDQTLDVVTRVFAGRLCAIALASTSNWGRAAQVFLESASAADAERPSLKTMKIGLQADAAFALWKSGDRASAVGLLISALESVESVPVDTNLRNRHLHATLRHMIVWCWSSLSGEPPKDMLEPTAGFCSNQDPHEGMAKFEIRDLASIWIILAFVDVRLDARNGLGSKVRGRLGQLPPSSMAHGLLRQLDVDRLSRGDGVHDAVTTIIGMFESAFAYRQASTRGNSPDSLPLEGLPREYWNDPGQRLALRRLLLAAAVIAAAFRVTPNPLSDWNSQLLKFGVSDQDATRLLQLLAEPSERPGEGLLERAASALAQLRERELTPAALFRCHVVLFNALSGGDAQALVSNALVMLAMRWVTIAREQSFALVSPRTTGPALITACEDPGTSGFQKVACILLAASEAAGVPLSSDAREHLRAVGSQPDRWHM